VRHRIIGRVDFEDKMAKTARNNTTRKPAEPVRELLVPDYGEWLANLKSRISSARERATVAVNQELVRLYHQIGWSARNVKAGERK
jgi:hypothetical protein